MRRLFPGRDGAWLRRVTPALAALALVSGCDLAPRYDPPHELLPADYAGSGPFGVAHPADTLPRGPWWTMFGDPLLDRLEDQAVAGNPDLATYAEQYVQARDLAAEARANLFPQIGANLSSTDNRQSIHKLFRTGDSGPNEASSNEIEGTASWEPDFWDRIRNQTRLQKRLAQASAANLANARLSLQAELADDYVALRGLDSQSAVYVQSIGFYRKAVEITSLRLAGKIASGLDVARAQNQLAATQALETGVVAQRAVLQHAIAVLVGVTPSSFAIAPVDDARLTVPRVPSGVPSQLLQRRPDIASAERQMAAANAGIGVSRAAFYPDINISLTGGFEDTGFNLASLPNSLWTIGAGAMLPLFEGGLRRAELQRSWSQYAQTRDAYRSIVLSAFQEVEDGLTLTTQLQAEAQQQAQAVTSAEQAQTITLQLYTGGLTNYLDAVVAQVTALTARIAEVQVETQRVQATVDLVRALGGGWSMDDLPSENGVLPFQPLAVIGSDRRPRPDGTGAGNAEASYPGT
ncbi:efflux transporter outer membrane subunit [Lichenicola sp.]|uniref:efflux transporter outer membrane subunit n=1 Tax=Lichenicola sp. TaxID=2804529 RepID=UPI003B0005D2